MPRVCQKWRKPLIRLVRAGARGETARREWRWIDRNPAKDVRKPPDSPPRRRGVPQQAIDAILDQLTGPVGVEVARAFRFALETAMRASEILSLDWSRVDLARRVAFLPTTKNGAAREVPLSSAAIAILGTAGRGAVFPISSASLDRLFRKARDRTEFKDVHFHDARSEAITRLSKKLDVLELARVVGHRDIRSLMIYYRADAEELAKKLD